MDSTINIHHMLLVIVKANLYGDNSFTTNGNFLVSNYGVKYNLLLTVNNIEILFKFKCGAVFVHLQRGSDKTQNRINECFTPHLNRYENCGAKLFWPNLSKQENECCSLPRFTLKLSDFFVRTE